MIYEYKCKKCEKVQDVELDVQGLLPKEVPCQEDGCDGMMVRVWSLSVAIPEHMKAGSPQGYNYEKKLTGIRTSGGTCGLIRYYARNLTWV